MEIDLEKTIAERKTSGLDKLIIKLDHVAYRVKIGERLATIQSLMQLLPYRQFKNFMRPFQ